MSRQTMSNDAMQCIETCEQCHRTCLQTAMMHCLTMGGMHVEAQHFRLMVNCAEICQTSANFMTSGSKFDHRICALCAEVCETCAKSCEQIGGMEECAKACRACARSCRTMADASQ